LASAWESALVQVWEWESAGMELAYRLAWMSELALPWESQLASPSA